MTKITQRQQSRFSKKILTPKQANIYIHGFQSYARFTVLCAGRRFGKNELGLSYLDRAIRMAVEWDIDTDNEIWVAMPTESQLKKNFWSKIKQILPKEQVESVTSSSGNFSAVLKSGHVIRGIGLHNYENLRGGGIFFLLIDEFASCKLEAWTEVLYPMLGTCKWKHDGREYQGGHALIMGTPKGFNHFYDYYCLLYTSDAADE
jgi:hypothetical protein